MSFFLTLIPSRQSRSTSIKISTNKRIIYNPWELQPQLQKMSETSCKTLFSFGIHEKNAFSGKAIQLNILLSSPSIVVLQSERWMTRQSHIRYFNHVVMKGNLAHDKLLWGLKQEQRSCNGRLVPGWDSEHALGYKHGFRTQQLNPPGFPWKIQNFIVKGWQETGSVSLTTPLQQCTRVR